MDVRRRSAGNYNYLPCHFYRDLFSIERNPGKYFYKPDLVRYPESSDRVAACDGGPVFLREKNNRIGEDSVDSSFYMFHSVFHNFDFSRDLAAGSELDILLAVGKLAVNAA